MAEITSTGAIDTVDVSERRWAYVVALVVVFLFAVIIFTGVHWSAQPPSNVETIDASRLHLAGEFMEANLGTGMQPDGSAIVTFGVEMYPAPPAPTAIAVILPSATVAVAVAGVRVTCAGGGSSIV